MNIKYRVIFQMECIGIAFDIMAAYAMVDEHAAINGRYDREGYWFRVV